LIIFFWSVAIFLEVGQTQLRMANILWFFMDWGRKIGGGVFGHWAPKLKGVGRTIIFTMRKVKQKRREIQILYKVHPAKCRIQSDALETCLFLARNSILILSLHFLLVRTIAFLSGPFFLNFGGNFDFFCVFFFTVFYLFFWLVCR